MRVWCMSAHIHICVFIHSPGGAVRRLDELYTYRGASLIMCFEVGNMPCDQLRYIRNKTMVRGDRLNSDINFRNDEVGCH